MLTLEVSRSISGCRRDGDAGLSLTSIISSRACNLPCTALKLALASAAAASVAAASVAAAATMYHHATPAAAATSPTFSSQQQ